MTYQPIDPDFFTQQTIDIAKLLIGQLLVHEHKGELLVGRIIETEAYQGPEDRAAHSFNNRKTKRTKVMFERAGLIYTYQMHTHTLLNIVTGPKDIPHAVLIRAVEPIEGISRMRKNRGSHIKDINLTNGPGKLTKAMAITMNYYGHDITKKPLYIAEGSPPDKIIAGPRVGIPNAKEAVHYPWRFKVPGTETILNN